MTNDLHFPWRTANSVSLLEDGTQFFPRMLQALAQARRYVLLEMYLFESGTVATQFISAFVQAAQRGIQVHLLLDDFGCRALNSKDRSTLTNAGVQLCFYNPLHYGQLRRALFRDHRKILIIDGELCFVGGVGLADEFSGRDGMPGWRETLVEVSGPCVNDWVVLFSDTWQKVSLQPLQIVSALSLTYSVGVRGRVACVHSDDSQGIKRALINRARGAEYRIWIATAYFVPSVKIRRALSDAARRGVDVRLLLPGEVTDHPAVRHAGRRFYYSLLRSGVRIFEYQPRFTHAKVQLTDAWVSIGSSNIDRWNFRWNLEANQEIEDQQFSDQVALMFERDFGQSDEIRVAVWRQRPWYWRVREWFWGRVDLWLDKLSLLFKKS